MSLPIASPKLRDERDAERNQPNLHCGGSAAREGSTFPRIFQPSDVRVASAGDHHTIHRFLLSVGQPVSQGEFQSQLDDPYYEPTDRLLVKRQDQIIAHARTIRREMKVGSLVCPVTWLDEVVSLPEFGGSCAVPLIQAAETAMLEDGSVLGLVRTRSPQAYLNQGWVICGRHSYASHGARDILSHLSAMRSTEDPTPTALSESEPTSEPGSIRLWRHIEQAALDRLYSENTADATGALVRGETYWRWLIGRRGYDRLYVAINGPDKMGLDDSLASIVGYAAMRDGRISELMTTPGNRQIACDLLARACRDAIENDFHTVRIDLPPGHPLHKIIVAAGGKSCCHESDNGEVFLVKMFDPLAFLDRMRPLIHKRTRASAITIPCELGLQIAEEKVRIAVSRRVARIVPGKVGRSYLEMDWPELVQMLLGHLDIGQAVKAGRIQPSTRVAIETGSALFPRQPIWYPTLDWLPTR